MRKPDWLGLPHFIHRVTKRDGFWWVAGLIAILVFGVGFSWLFWEELRGDDESLSSTIRNLGLVGGGIVAIVLAVWRSLVAQKQAEAALRQADTALRQAETAQKGLLNERYQQGAEMLGNDVLSVRLGGIYALQRLAEEHPEQYHIQIARLFCAFARHPTQGKPPGSEQSTGDSGPAMSEAEEQMKHLLDRLRPVPWSLMREDVKAVIEAISFRRRSCIALERAAYYSLDLQGANLASMHGMGDLSNADLSGANLASTYLLNVNLSDAKLFFVDLSNALLVKANLSGAHFSGANLSDARLSGANLSGTELQGVENLTQKQLDQARADPRKPPKLEGTVDAETGLPLVWCGKPLDDEV